MSNNSVNSEKKQLDFRKEKTQRTRCTYLHLKSNKNVIGTALNSPNAGIQVAEREASDDITFELVSNITPRQHPLLFFFSSIIANIFWFQKIQSKNPITTILYFNGNSTFIYGDGAFNPLRDVSEKQEVIRRDFRQQQSKFKHACHMIFV